MEPKKESVLNFKPDLIDEILAGKKYNTWRIWPNRYVVVGEEVDLINSSTEKKFARARILEKCIKKFVDLTDYEKEGHEKFASEDAMYKTYGEYYKIPVDENTEITVIKFQLI